ncbi:cysteine-rich receptor-like protein kinase 7 [Durio zibethinus]|uniref:Cysteine-rich receptor-like protein kinase 7 n=1 Tax=Durio zibethinus TaxID=66656 RepID=A0A6P5WQA9_DURZI|nr:cysteine-rich receptor-like protein kinase 7 [Durio zibethinus]
MVIFFRTEMSLDSKGLTRDNSSGYMSPEYAVNGKFSAKSDVFSFSVLVLEVISGQKIRSFCHPDHHHSLLEHAWLVWNAMELVDACLEDSISESQVLRCIRVGLLCVQNYPRDRPTMSSVNFMLANEGAILPLPKEPGFFTDTITGTTTRRKEEQHTLSPPYKLLGPTNEFMPGRYMSRAKCIQLGLTIVFERSQRIGLSCLLTMLVNDREILPESKQPSFFIAKSLR